MVGLEGFYRIISTEAQHKGSSMYTLFVGYMKTMTVTNDSSYARSTGLKLRARRQTMFNLSTRVAVEVGVLTSCVPSIEMTCLCQRPDHD